MAAATLVRLLPPVALEALEMIGRKQVIARLVAPAAVAAAVAVRGLRVQLVGLVVYTAVVVRAVGPVAGRQPVARVRKAS